MMRMWLRDIDNPETAANVALTAYTIYGKAVDQVMRDKIPSTAPAMMAPGASTSCNSPSRRIPAFLYVPLPPPATS
jgi:hypothetical protein